MILSGKTVKKAIYIVSAVVAVINLCLADFHDSSISDPVDIVFSILFVIFPSIPLLFLSIKIFEKLPKTTAILATIEAVIILDLIYEINFGHTSSSTSAVALFFLPLYLLVLNVVIALLALVISTYKK
jgi:hypothetical protein